MTDATEPSLELVSQALQTWYLGKQAFKQNTAETFLRHRALPPPFVALKKCIF